MITYLGLSTYHILILVLILILLFGAKKIPELMRGFGSGIKEFKDAVKEDDKPANPTNNYNSTPTPPPVYPNNEVPQNAVPPVQPHYEEKK